MNRILQSPAIAVIGRHNSGKTTLVERLIRRLCSWGVDVGSVKHHGHRGFDIDIPGKDSFRHRAAGASETFIAAPGQVAMVKTITGEMECSEIIDSMPGHDVVIVEGYRLSGLPAIEVMRAENERDMAVARALFDNAENAIPLSCDVLQSLRCRSDDGHGPDLADDLVQKMPGAQVVAIASDIPLAHEAARIYGIPSFDIDDANGIAAFIRERYVRPRLTVAIQAGGESSRMGQSKALVPFLGRPLIARLVERLAPVADELIITTNEPEKLEFLHSWFPNLGIRLVSDECEYRGALPGIYTALKAANSPLVGVVACDMVFASASLVAAEYHRAVEESADICIPKDLRGMEPFHALYRRETCLPVCEELLSQGGKRPQALLDQVKVSYFRREQLLGIDSEGLCFVNVNTPDDLVEAERLAVAGARVAEGARHHPGGC